MNSRIAIFNVALIVLLVLSSCAPLIPDTGGQGSKNNPETKQENNQGSQSIGTVANIKTQVRAGLPDNLKLIQGKADLGNDDFVSVTDGGKARLEFPGPINLLLFNQSEMDGIKLEYDADSNPRIVNRLVRGGFSGYVEPGHQLTVDLAFGVKVNVLGTQFFIIYDDENGYIIIGKFDGTLIVSIPGQPDIKLGDSELVDITSAGKVRRYSPFVFTPSQFEQMADRCNSSAQGVNVLRRDNKLPLPDGRVINKNTELPCGTLQQIQAVPTAEVINLDYCYRSDEDICVYGVGMLRQDMMITVQIDRPNLSNPYILVDKEKLYRCKEISAPKNRYYCLGDPLPTNVSVTAQVFDGFEGNDVLLAQGELVIPFLTLRPTARPRSQPKYPYPP